MLSVSVKTSRSSTHARKDVTRRLLWPIPRSTTLICPLCVGVVVLLSVSGRLPVPQDQAHSMTKGRPARKMSECIYLSHCQAQLRGKVILKRDQAFRFHHPKRFKTSFQKSGGTFLLTGPPPLTLPLFYPYGLTTSQTSALLTSLPIPPFWKSRTPSQK